MNERVRGFEVVSKLINDKIKVPQRATEGSAGYDFFLYEDIEIKPGLNIIKTGIKAYMRLNEVLLLFIRSSLALKYGLMLANSVAVIDSTFYNSDETEGEICFLIYNLTNNVYKFNKGDRIGQGVFMKYFIVDNDNPVNSTRIGGFGSTGA